jgi:phage tail sheath gpL-like
MPMFKLITQIIELTKLPTIIKLNKLQVNMELNNAYLLNTHDHHSKCLLIERNNNAHEKNHANG